LLAESFRDQLLEQRHPRVSLVTLEPVEQPGRLEVHRGMISNRDAVR